MDYLEPIIVDFSPPTRQDPQRQTLIPYPLENYEHSGDGAKFYCIIA